MNASEPNVVWTGSHYRVVWLGQSGTTTSLQMVVIESDDALTNRSSLLDSETHFWFPHAIWNGCQLAVVYGASGELGGLLLGP